MVRNKTASIIDHIIDADLQCLALTETWLQTRDIDQCVIVEVTPEGYSVHHVSMVKQKGGSVGLLIRDSFKVTVQPAFKASSFKSLHVCASLLCLLCSE